MEWNYSVLKTCEYFTQLRTCTNNIEGKLWFSIKKKLIFFYFGDMCNIRSLQIATYLPDFLHTYAHAQAYILYRAKFLAWSIEYLRRYVN
jgi:hypothetical protein